MGLYDTPLMISGVDEKGSPVPTKDKKVDVLVPANNVITLRRVQHRDMIEQRVTETHSFAAPFVTVATLIAKAKYGGTPAEIRERIKKATNQTDAGPVLDFEKLLNQE